MGARGERSVSVIAPTRPPAATHNEIGTPWAAVLGPEERGPVSLSHNEIGAPWAAVLGPEERGLVSLSEAVLPEAEGSVG